MSVKVHDPKAPAPLTSGGKPVSSKSTHQPSKSAIVFEKILHGISVRNGDSESLKTAALVQHRRPPTSMINNRGGRQAEATILLPAQAQNTNLMAASALISLAALTSGPNRLSSFYSMGSGIAGHAGAAALLNASSADRAAAGGARGVGSLSARFESGENGPETIGFDPKGGTSYGTFQISSGAGTMHRFIDYLEEKAPGLANRLKAAGAANTGSRHGKMPEVWKKIAAEDPERFSKLQYDFIEQTHYLPALREIEEQTGVDLGQSPKAVQEVLWSTAVQHGPNGAAKIFSKAVGRARQKSGSVAAARLIGSVYAMRAGQFGSSPADIREAVRNRFKSEGKLALAMLAEPSSPDSATA